MPFDMLAQLALFVPAAILVSLTPGANNMLSLVNGMRAGVGVTMLSLFGRMAAFLLLLGGVALGLGALFEASVLAFIIVKWAGVAYLAWMGIGLLRAGSLGLSSEPSSYVRSPWSLARSEFIVAIANPKAILLFTAFLPQFVTGDAPVALQLWSLGLVYLLIEYVVASLYAVTGARVGRVLDTPVQDRWAARVFGGVMLGMAGVLATVRRGT